MLFLHIGPVCLHPWCPQCLPALWKHCCGCPWTENGHCRHAERGPTDQCLWIWAAVEGKPPCLCSTLKFVMWMCDELWVMCASICSSCKNCLRFYAWQTSTLQRSKESQHDKEEHIEGQVPLWVYSIYRFLLCAWERPNCYTSYLSASLTVFTDVLLYRLHWPHPLVCEGKPPCI